MLSANKSICWNNPRKLSATLDAASWEWHPWALQMLSHSLTTTSTHIAISVLEQHKPTSQYLPEVFHSTSNWSVTMPGLGPLLPQCCVVFCCKNWTPRPGNPVASDGMRHPITLFSLYSLAMVAQAAGWLDCCSIIRVPFHFLAKLRESFVLQQTR